jgi:hypothetical protein
MSPSQHFQVVRNPPAHCCVVNREFRLNTNAERVAFRRGRSDKYKYISEQIGVFSYLFSWLSERMSLVGNAIEWEDSEIVYKPKMTVRFESTLLLISKSPMLVDAIW